MDSECSKHMTGKTKEFLSQKAFHEGVPFRNGEKGNIKGVFKIGKSPNRTIKNVYFIDRLKYSLLSVS